jgi:predicted RNase H-like nuclease (RuvC/YqgF family)
MENWVALLKIIGSGVIGAGLWAIVREIIRWVRHRPEDLAKAEKMKAEAKEITLRGKLDVFERQDLIIKHLDEECEQTKKQLEEAQKIIIGLRTQLASLEALLNKEQENNRTCTSEVEQLRIEVSRLKRDGRRPT